MKPSDRRLTPDHILSAVRDYAGGPIAFDPCTEPDNPTKALQYRCYEGTDALPLGWGHHARTAAMAYEAEHSRVLRSTVWVNPPFSKRGRWDLAAIQAGEAGVATFVYAAYAATSHVDRLNQHATCRADLFGYLRCLDPATGRMMEIARAASVWLMGGHLTVARCFGRLGQIIPLDTVRALTALGQALVAFRAEAGALAGVFVQSSKEEAGQWCRKGRSIAARRDRRSSSRSKRTVAGRPRGWRSLSSRFQ